MAQNTMPLNNNGNSVELLRTDSVPVHRLSHTTDEVTPGGSLRFECWRSPLWEK